MRLFSLFFLFIFLLASSCKENRPKVNNADNTLEQDSSTKTATLESKSEPFSDKGSLRFLDNFVYSYINGEDSGAVVLYYDAVNELVLYEPKDDMTDFVIIDKEGAVYLFYTGEHGDKIIHRDHINFTPDNPEISYPVSKRFMPITPINDRFILDQSVFSKPDITFKGYRLKYVQYQDSLDFYITDDITINSEQLHGFEQLVELDWNYPLPLGSLTQVVSDKQLIGKVSTTGLSIELKYYASTDFYARISDYDYFVADKNGALKKEILPLMKFAIK